METGVIVAAAAGGLIGFAILSRKRATNRAARRRRNLDARPRRQLHLEKHVAEEGFGPIRRVYGEIFASFSIFRSRDAYHMNVETQGAWPALNKFTKAMIMRFLWRTVAAATKAPVNVSVDAQSENPLRWTGEHTAAFDDRGVAEPWAKANGRAGTLISSTQRDAS